MILDASALLAYLLNEPGGDAVRRALVPPGMISSVNLAEVLERLAADGGGPARTLDELRRTGVVGTAIHIEPFLTEDAVDCAILRPLTRHAGLSLGDRACLALARRSKTPVLTTDTAWSRVDVGVDVRQIR